MFSHSIRMTILAAALSVAGGVDVSAGHSASLNARLTLLNGTTRTVALEGVGCPVSLCSRVVVKSTARGEPEPIETLLNTISAIKDITKDDALFVFKNGVERRLAVVPLNRVLYLETQSGIADKIELATVRSIEFLEPVTR